MGSKKILIITSEFPPNVGGIGNHAYSIAKYLCYEGYTVSVLADLIDIDGVQLEQFKKENPFTLYPILRSSFLPFTYIARVTKSIKLAAKHDVVICSSKFSLWLIAAMKPFFSKKKYLAVVHGSELLLPNKKAKQLTDHSLKQYQTIIAVSGFTKSLLQAGLQTKTIVIPNGIDNKEFAVAASAGKTFTADAAINIVTLGNVTERKGQENVIRALPEMIKLFPHIHYHIVGKPTMKDAFEKIIASLQIQSYVTFHGIVSRADLVRLLNESDVKLMLSNNTAYGDVEGFGIAVLEANALGKPAIGSNNNGIKDAIDDYKTGRLVDAKNTTEIALALKEIIGNYTAYSNHAKQWALQHDWASLIKKYSEVIEAV
jgi:glycosyltransferase involved in cell wall biosynthesis